MEVKLILLQFALLSIVIGGHGLALVLIALFWLEMYFERTEVK